jgi:hypothetical protein
MCGIETCLLRFDMKAGSALALLSLIDEVAELVPE